MHCNKCGNQIMNGSRFCSECGYSFGTPTSKPSSTMINPMSQTRDQKQKSNYVYPKNPPLSPHLSWINLLMSGLSHIVYGQVAKGFFLAIATIIAAIIFPYIGNLLICFLSIIDSYKIAKKLKSGYPVKTWEWFPNT